MACALVFASGRIDFEVFVEEFLEGRGPRRLTKVRLGLALGI